MKDQIKRNILCAEAPTTQRQAKSLLWFEHSKDSSLICERQDGTFVNYRVSTRTPNGGTVRLFDDEQTSLMYARELILGFNLIGGPNTTVH